MQLPSESLELHMDKEAKKLADQSDGQPQPTVQGELDSLPSKEPSRKRAKRAAKQEQANPPHGYVATASDKPLGKSAERAAKQKQANATHKSVATSSDQRTPPRRSTRLAERGPLER